MSSSLIFILASKVCKAVSEFCTNSLLVLAKFASKSLMASCELFSRPFRSFCNFLKAVTDFFCRNCLVFPRFSWKSSLTYFYESVIILGGIFKIKERKKWNKQFFLMKRRKNIGIFQKFPIMPPAGFEPGTPRTRVHRLTNGAIKGCWGTTDQICGPRNALFWVMFDGFWSVLGPIWPTLRPGGGHIDH